MNITKFNHFKKAKPVLKKIHHYSKGPFWFSIGFAIAGITLVAIFIIFFQLAFKETVIPGVFIDNVYVGEMTHSQVKSIYDSKNEKISDSQFNFTYENNSATVSAKELNIGYNSGLIADQAINLGKTPNVFTNFYIIVNSYINGITLQSSFTYDEEKLLALLQPIRDAAHTKPVDALFAVENNRVTTFQQSKDGTQADIESVKKFMEERVRQTIRDERVQIFKYEVPVITLEPDITTEEVNDFGIVEEIGYGKSYYRGSIPNRIHNVSLAASRINGILVKPDEEFSFVKYLGDVSKLTGYKEAYIISGGKTILGDGGGVCQVSSTLFRAILDSGLPITERRAHAYRVGYYEQESYPGLDATVYVPTVDLKFKNDTGKHVLIQSLVNPTEQSLTYVIYGTNDGREVEVTTPVVTNVIGAPEPLYQDDPNLPKDTIKQIDYAANGATVVFSRTVTKDGKTLIDEEYISRYTPWRAVFLRGTREG